MTMFTRRLKEPFGKAGLTVAILALVLAMVGGAYAAGALSGKQKKEVEKIAKKFAGKPGAAGATGPAGAAGKNATDGTNGANGTNGVSPLGTKFNGNSEGCTEGGVRFVGANTTVACNGVKGTTGFTNFLPEGKTETGTWSAHGDGRTITTEVEGTKEEIEVGSDEVIVPLSFAIPLEGDTAITEAHFVTVAEQNGGTQPAGCEGGSSRAPVAEPGVLCVFSDEATSGVGAVLIGNAAPSFHPPLGGPGALMLVEFQSGGGIASGSWAVTAPAG